MKKAILSIALLTGMFSAKAQVFNDSTTISDFENVVLTSSHQTVYNDSIGGGGFKSGTAYFSTQWDTSYGGYWSSGWAASAVYDSINAYPNFYGCIAYKGVNASHKFAVGTTYGNLTVKLTDSLVGKSVLGAYICNSTYAYRSMQNGDQFAHKFTGVNKDWFKLSIGNYYNGIANTDTVSFYLADFRYADTTQNYILKTWTWVNLTSLGKTDSLAFNLSSSDTSYGFMNTPAYFCMDNLALNTSLGIENYLTENSLNIYPNPAASETEIVYNTKASVSVNMKIYDMMGREIGGQTSRSFAGLNKFKIDVSNLPAGVYYINLNAGGTTLTKKLIVSK